MVKKSKTSRRSKPISLAQLISKVGTGKITEAEVGQYFFSRPPAPRGYVPQLAIDPTTVDIGDKETVAQAVGNDLGYKAIETVRAAKRIKAGAPPPDGSILAEGDSWFNLPEFGFPINVPPTLVDVLASKHPIDNIAHWGDTLAQIVNAAEYAGYLRTGKVKYFLFSGGGNDILGGGNLANFLHQRRSGDNDPNNAPRYINPLFDQALNEVMFLYGVLIENVRQMSPKTIVLVHGYDYALPVPGGQWLGEAMAFRGFSPTANKVICRAVIKEMLRRFNARLSALAADSKKRVRYVPLVDIVGTGWWDELHPNKQAAQKLSTPFDKALQ